MALATLGLLILRSASITFTSSDGVRVGGPTSQGVPAPLEQHRLDGLDGLLDRLEIRIDAQGTLEVVQGAVGLVHVEINHAVAAQGAEVVGVSLHHLVTVGQRSL